MKKTFKSKFLAIILACLMVVTIGCFAGCNKEEANGVSFENAYDTSVLGGIGLMSQGLTGTGTQTATESAVVTPQGASFTITAEAKDNMLKNLTIAQNMANGDVVKSEITTSNVDGYTYMYTLSAQNIAGEEKIYQFHYNNLSTNRNETIFEGIVIIDGVTYTVRGESEIEIDEEEFSFLIKLNDNLYVEVSQETETEANKTSTEFTYELYVNGRQIYDTSVEYEQLANGNVALSFETESFLGSFEYEYEFITSNGENFVKVTVETEVNNVGNAKLAALVKITTDNEGNMTFEFTDDFVVEGNLQIPGTQPA